MRNHVDPSDLLLPAADSPLVIVDEDSAVRTAACLPNVAVLPGSFNPLHSGHILLKETAARLLQANVVFELSITNVEKETLSHADAVQRLKQFNGHTVAVTTAPTFREKLQLFPACCFVVGFDTAERVIDRAFYNGSEEELHQFMDECLVRGHRFLVAGRRHQSGSFQTVDELQIAERYSVLFTGLSEAEFREDISSTELRRQPPA